MFGLSKRERALYQKIIDIQQEEITTLRLQLGLYSQPAEREEATPPKTEQYENFQITSDLEEDLEWELESGRISLDEFEARMRTFGIDLEPIERN